MLSFCLRGCSLFIVDSVLLPSPPPFHANGMQKLLILQKLSSWWVWKNAVHEQSVQCQPSVSIFKKNILILYWKLIENQPRLRQVNKEPPIISHKRGKSLQLWNQSNLPQTGQSSKYEQEHHYTRTNRCKIDRRSWLSLTIVPISILLLAVIDTLGFVFIFFL